MSDVDVKWLDVMASFMVSGSVNADMLRASGNVPEHVVQMVIEAANAKRVTPKTVVEDFNHKESTDGQEKHS